MPRLLKHAFAAFALAVIVSLSAAHALHRARDEQLDLVEIERLRHEIVSPAFHRFDRSIDRTVSRHHDADGRPGRCAERGPQPVVALLILEPRRAGRGCGAGRGLRRLLQAGLRTDR